MEELRPTSPAMPEGDVVIQGELCASHLRLQVSGFREDDAETESDQTVRLLSLDDLAVWCETLATGDDHETSEEAWGRVHRSIFSFDPYNAIWRSSPEVWFYPMSEVRLALRVEARRSITALLAALRWAWDHVDVVEAAARHRAGA